MNSLSTASSETPQLPGWSHLASGKVRDLYTPEGQSVAEASTLLLVASNRVSAFDHLLEPEIPGKGSLLTELSKWWFKRIDMPNHLTDVDPPAEVSDRAVVVKKLTMLPVECVVRGAITGSGYAEYRETGAVCGIQLSAGLSDGDLLETPIFTPAYKAPQGEHDENITYQQVVELVGADHAAALKQRSLEIFTAAREIAAERGVILADTKFEFGVDEDGVLTLADEVLTSDSSRYWDKTTYESESGSARLASFDKQIVRNWLLANWDRKGTPPELPAEIVELTRARYQELFDLLTGETV